MDNAMWFGTRGFMTWVPCPDSGGDHSKIGWSGSSQYLNGGAGVRASTGSHKVYQLSWNMYSPNELRPITDFSDGLYNSQDGVNLVYFHDPMTTRYNVLPQLWASPAQSTVDGLTLFPGQTPQSVQTPANSLRYPARSALYVANTSSQTVWVPIPPGMVAWVGVHGSATGSAGFTVATTTGLTTSAATPITLLSVTDSTRCNASYASSSGIDGIMLGLVNNGPASTDTITLSGVMVQILPVGVTPDTGEFISGQGHSGCQFEEKPIQTPYSSVLGDGGFVGMSATLTETGSWL